MNNLIAQNPWHDVVRTWSSRLAPTSARTYRVAIDRLGQHLATTSITDTLMHLFGQGPAAASAILGEWANALQRDGLAPRSVASFVSVPVNLFRIAHQLGAVPWVPLAPKIRLENRHDRRGPSRHDLERLLQHVAAATDRRAHRDIAAIRLMACAGLRRSEVARLTVADIDLSEEPAVLVTRKGHTEKTRVSIGDSTAASLVRWIAEHARGKSPPEGTREDSGVLNRVRLFPCGESMRRMLRARAAAAGINHPIRPHGLRHRGASEAARAGFAPLMAFGGWRSAGSALHYLDDQAANRALALELTEL